MCFKRVFLALIFWSIALAGFAQSCPPNIGFESGTLNGWKCYIGRMDRDGVDAIDWGSPVPGGVAGRHTVLKNTSPQSLDPVGQFPVNSPNGSNYSLMLGNMQVSGGGGTAGAGGFCERMTYDFVVPEDDFTMVYYYAVVFQNPKDHTDNQQPKFIANLLNLDKPDDVACGSFSFTASAGLQGFISGGSDVYYKAWSPLVIRITGHKGQNFQLEFITKDCSKGGHYGYAYIDFNEDCGESPITGNNYCAGAADFTTLTAPAGFEKYTWKDEAGNIVGTSPTLKVSPIPADGTKVLLHIVPYKGLGCENDFTTTIQRVNEPFVLNVKPLIKGCLATGVNLRADEVTAGSSSDMKYQYYTDASAQTFLSDPNLVKEPGDYYIRGTNSFGCTAIAQITVELNEGPKVKPETVLPACAPATIDLTKAVTITDPNVVVTYYSDIALTKTVANPKVLTVSGIYYVKAVNPAISCATVTAVNVIISPLPAVTNKVLKGCPDLSLITAATDGADISGLTFHFFTDQQVTVPVKDPTKISESGTFYYYATNQYSCPGNIAKIDVTVYPVPFFKVTDPDPVVFPTTVNLINTHPPLTFAEFSYWKDAACTILLDNYQAISESGTFYIKAISAGGCPQIHPVTVLVNAPPEPDLVGSNTFTPNGDGVNDEFRPQTKGVFKLNYLKIVNRYGQEIFQTKEILNRWAGTSNGQAAPVGTYFWIFSAYDLYRKKDFIKSGSVTIIR